jgi:DNA-binding GntR family transcriptional regulator
MPKLQSLNRPDSLSKLAYDALLKSILSGELTASEIYNEKSLAEELGISRTPVREALLELSAQGLVQFLPRKGITVNRFTEQDVVEIFEIRRAIESAAVEKIARLSPPAEMTGVDKTLADQIKAAGKNDVEAFLAADRAYQVLFSELTTNRRMKEIMENIRNLVHLMSIQALRVSGRAQIVLDEHRRIIQAVKDGNAKAARTAMLDHLLASEKAVLESL